MKKGWLFGFALGLVLGTGTAAVAATCIGTGYLMGWTVQVNVDGEPVECSDPYVWASIRQIECDAD